LIQEGYSDVSKFYSSLCEAVKIISSMNNVKINVKRYPYSILREAFTIAKQQNNILYWNVITLKMSSFKIGLVIYQQDSSIIILKFHTLFNAFLTNRII